MRRHSFVGRDRFLVVAAWLALSILLGCGNSGTPLGQGPLGPAEACTLLAPLAGSWTFDVERTLEAQKTAGVSEAEIERARALFAHPALGQLHADLNFNGNEAVGSAIPHSEYRFFAVHEHDGKICGKAWHHEDRDDPGDMSKCYVRLTPGQDSLIFEVKMAEEAFDLEDPDWKSPPPVELASSDGCDAEAPAGGPWSEWMTSVYIRKP